MYSAGARGVPRNERTRVLGVPSKPLIDLSKLGSDDLLLLGLAFLIFTDKEREGDIPVDALLILATLFLSGL